MLEQIHRKTSNSLYTKLYITAYNFSNAVKGFFYVLSVTINNHLQRQCKGTNKFKPLNANRKPAMILDTATSILLNL